MNDGRGAEGAMDDGMETAKGWMKGSGEGGEEEKSGTSDRNEGKERRSCRDGKGGGF